MRYKADHDDDVVVVVATFFVFLLNEENSNEEDEVRVKRPRCFYGYMTRFQLTPKYVTLNDLEWPFYVKFSLLSTALSEIILHTYAESIYRIFLLHHVTSRDVRKRTVICRIFGIHGRTAELS